QTHGVTWTQYPFQQAPANFIPYAVSFIPGTSTAIITSNAGVFRLKSPQDALTTFVPAPTTWDASNSQISVGGNASHYTLSGVSMGSGVADYTVGAAAVGEVMPSATTLRIQCAPNPFSN